MIAIQFPITCSYFNISLVRVFSSVFLFIVYYLSLEPPILFSNGANELLTRKFRTPIKWK